MRQDDTEDTDQKEIKAARAQKPWMQAVIAGLMAIVAALGGVNYYQVDQVSRDPTARADAFSGSDADKMETRLHTEFSRRLKEDLDVNMRQWEEIAHSIREQHDTVDTLRETVAQMLSRCAEIQERDNAMQQQIIDIRGLLYSHLGLSGNRGSNSHQLREALTE